MLVLTPLKKMYSSNDTIQTPWKKNNFFSISLCCVVNDCSWKLWIGKKQKSCTKRIPLVADDGLYNQKGFYKNNIFIYSLWVMANLSIVNILLKRVAATNINIQKGK